MTRPKRYISKDTFETALIEAKSLGIREITLSYAGEPLLHPDVLDYVKMLTDQGFYSRITTNGYLLTPSMSRSLIDVGLDWISVSMHAITPEVYKKITGVSAFHEVIENVRAMYYMRDKPFMSSNYFIMKENEKEYDPHRHPLKHIVDELVVSFVRDLPTTSGKHAVVPMKRRSVPCTILFNVMTVFADGTRGLGCCFDCNALFKIGYSGSITKHSMCKYCPDELYQNEVRDKLCQQKRTT
jgi:sulfatase maturation enzyme AslB (radical SAM superfamily)